MTPLPKATRNTTPRATGGFRRPAAATADPIAAARFALATDLEEKPSTRLSLIDPDREQAGAGHVSLLVAKRVRFAQVRRQLLAVVISSGAM
jgi:hypothetical protein